MKTMSTIGHGRRSVEELVSVLEAYGVTQIVDIRKMPRSLANPQFNAETLPAALAARGIAYVHMPGLTGLRKRKRDSANGAWRNASFRAFADYMQTPAFAAAVDELMERAEDRPTALMCAETMPWRCHRSLVADAVTARGVAVRHLLSATKAQAHLVPDFARFEGTRVCYPAPVD
jgi:uncharacterized protein (DUF488 family)